MVALKTRGNLCNVAKLRNNLKMLYKIVTITLHNLLSINYNSSDYKVYIIKVKSGYSLLFISGPDQNSLLAGGRPPRKNSGLSRVEEVRHLFKKVNI